MASAAAKTAAADRAPAPAAPAGVGVALEQGINVGAARDAAYQALLAAPRVGFEEPVLPPHLPTVPVRSGRTYVWVKGGVTGQVIAEVFAAIVPAEGGTYRFANYGDLVTVDPDSLAAGIDSGRLIAAD